MDAGYIGQSLFFTAKQDATVYCQVAGDTEFGFRASRPLTFCLTDAFYNVIFQGCEQKFKIALSTAGDYRLRFLADKNDDATIEIIADNDAIVYLMPGVGVLWEHGKLFPLLLAEREAHNIWLLASSEEQTDTVTVIKGADFGETIHVTTDGKLYEADWYPKLGRAFFWHSAELPKAVCTKFSVPAENQPVRFTAYNRTVAALTEPTTPFKWSCFIPKITDVNGEDLDARIEVYIGTERVAMLDRLARERQAIYLPAGIYTVRVSRGMLWEIAEQEIRLTDDTAIELTIPLAETVKLPEGWVFGELHTHSALEDATLFPRQVMRAARANGRSFCFMTDKNVEQLETFGLRECDKPGHFLGLPGQEIMAHELHTNVLNPAYTIYNPEANHLGEANPDIEEKITDWLSQVKEMKKTQPCMVMHNHPSHRSEISKRCAYFRSWWVSDLHPESYSLVENCDFPGWFDRLNRGRRLYAAWTGDGHDSTLMYPGEEGVCVYTGGELSTEAILKALESGKFFSCCAPGMVLLTDAKERTFCFRAEAATEIELVEVIADGSVIHTRYGVGKCRLDGEVVIPKCARWAIARAKLKNRYWDRTLYSFKPFMEDGFDAFTNPIFFE